MRYRVAQIARWVEQHKRPDGQLVAASGVDFARLESRQPPGLSQRIDPDRGKQRQADRQAFRPAVGFAHFGGIGQAETAQQLDQFVRRFLAHAGLAIKIRMARQE